MVPYTLGGTEVIGQDKAVSLIVILKSLVPKLGHIKLFFLNRCKPKVIDHMENMR